MQNPSEPLRVLSDPVADRQSVTDGYLLNVASPATPPLILIKLDGRCELGPALVDSIRALIREELHALRPVTLPLVPPFRSEP